MNKSEVAKLIMESKATSPSTRSFVSWLHENGYEIRRKRKCPPGLGRVAQYFLKSAGYGE